MASPKHTASFFSQATASQFEYVLTLYNEALKLKAEQKNKKPEELIKLDNWYQQELPNKIKSRGKDAHLTHDELVQTMKWKLARGKYRPHLKELVQMNTPRLVIMETKKALRQLKKKEDMPMAVQALCNLKGIGPATASAVLAAAAPESAPFMADECLLSIPELEGIDYTTKEYLKFVNHIKSVVERLNAETGNGTWNPHRVELAIWTHYVASKLKPELLMNIPQHGTVENGTDSKVPKNGTSAEENKDQSIEMGKDVEDDQSNDSAEIPSGHGSDTGAQRGDSENTNDLATKDFTAQNEDTNDSVTVSESTNDSTANQSEVTPHIADVTGDQPDDAEESGNTSEEPAAKKKKVDE